MTDFSAPVNTGIPARFLDHEGRFDIGRIRSEVSITAVAAAATDLKPTGEEARGLCPLHDENTPSFFVNEAKGTYHCFGCGSGGDVVRLHSLLHGTDFRRSCEDLVGDGATAVVRTKRAISPEEAAVRRVLAGNRAREEWRRAISIEGTPAERYLTNRGVGYGIPGSLRYGDVPRGWNEDGTPGPRHPAMIAALQDCNGRVCGIVRTFVTREGRRCPWGAPRLALGRVRGSAVRLGPVSSRLYVCSGIEDGLAIRCMFPGASVWVTPGDGNLPWLTLPAGVEGVVVCGDADASGSAAVGAAQDAFEAKGVETTAMFPKAGAKDFNEEWLVSVV